MTKSSILALSLFACFAAGAAHAGRTTPVLTDSAAVTVAKKGADDKQRDDRGGSRLIEESRGEQVAREGGVRGRGRGV